MKLFDCILYYDEDLILETRLNILNNYFDKFIICEAQFSHSGRKKKLNFDIKKFSKFRNKIVYIVVENEPEDIIYQDLSKNIEHPSNYRINAIKRIAHQRNNLLNAVNSLSSSDDYIFYSDNDEIPNMSSFEKTLKRKINIFEQDLFYYKFNLYCDRIKWYGTRAIKKKDLLNFEWLRQIKPKKYPFYRLDTLFKKDKFIDINIIENGGWHFTRVISPEEIHKKELDAEHHDEYRASNKNPEKIRDLIKRRVIDHNHLADSKESKYKNEFKLKLYDLKRLPSYIKSNKTKLKDFIEID
jgi:beta-1,4-mannosyl-glycoprotein beta-1,4-N-acetylglucosaminyltransferase